MSNWVSKDCELVICAYIVETLSLREGLPEKQSPKRGVATWASAMGNKKARKRNEADIGKREGERERRGETSCVETTITIFRRYHIITRSTRQDNKSRALAYH